MLRCEVCDNPISKERIETILTSTGSLPSRCVEHSNEPESRGFLSFGHKTGGQVVVAKGIHNINRAHAIHIRKR